MTNPQARRETERWLDYAQQDLNAAKVLLNQSGNFAQQVCYLSQQAAEKAIKAALIFLQIEFPFRHDLDMLSNLLPEEWQLRQHSSDLAQLTEWAVEARYPSLSEEPVTEDAITALAQAQAVIDLVLRDLSEYGF